MKTKTISILLFGLLIYFTSFAQHSPKEWLQVEAGVLTTIAPDPGAYLEVSYHKESESNSLQFGYRYAFTSHVTKRPGEKFNFIFGKMPLYKSHSRFFRLEWMVGSAFVWGTIRGDELQRGSTGGVFSVDEYQKEDFLSAGLETNLSVYGIVFNRVALGLNCWTHLNFERQMVGLGLHISGGKF
ncbi:MAG: hypothetical protein KDC24_03965 [Saprospiraceae bacterium]|nr:hypothetical protein [Saprospiraceae bacterium]